MSVQVVKMSQLLVCKYLVCEYLVFEVSVQNRGLFVTLYCSASQSHDCFQTEKLLSNIAKKITNVTIIAGDFNARSTTCLSRGTATTEATNIEALTSYHGFE